VSEELTVSIIYDLILLLEEYVSEHIQNESSQTFFDAITRVGVMPSKRSIYPGVIKLEVVRPIPARRLSSLNVELYGDGLLLACAIRTWDPVGRYYHAYLDPSATGTRSSFLPPPDISRCTSLKLFAGGISRELPNELSIFKESGE